MFTDYNNKEVLATEKQKENKDSIMDVDTLINCEGLIEYNNENIDKILEVVINNEVFPELIKENTSEKLDLNKELVNLWLFPELNQNEGNPPIEVKDKTNKESNNNQFADQNGQEEVHINDENNMEDKEETKTYESQEMEYSKQGDINIETPIKKKEMIPLELIMKHINSMIAEKKCGIVRKDIKRKMFLLATSLLGNPKGNIPQVLLREYVKAYFSDSEMESKVSGLKWLAGDLKKTRLQAKKANQEELEKYKNTPYEIEKDVLEGIVDTLTTKGNKKMKSAMDCLKNLIKKIN